MKSEVERNQKLVQVGDNLIYTDCSNSQRWVVTELFEGGFVAHNRELEESVEFEDGFEVFYFNSLQIGWEFTGKTKEKNFLNYRFRYV